MFAISFPHELSNKIALECIVITLVGIRFSMHDVIIFVKLEFISLIFSY